METLIIITNFLLLGLILIIPMLLLIYLKKRRGKKKILLPYYLISLLLLVVLIWIFVWWGNKSDMMILKHYGYNFDAWTEIERFQNVAQENMETVKRIEISIMGIGWPLKAIFGCVMIIPYLIIVYIGNKLIGNKKLK
jgi:4-amino-4-deoxy-L-arabinose transferase-like glycosyltransferase